MFQYVVNKIVLNLLFYKQATIFTLFIQKTIYNSLIINLNGDNYEFKNQQRKN